MLARLSYLPIEIQCTAIRHASTKVQQAQTDVLVDTRLRSNLTALSQFYESALPEQDHWQRRLSNALEDVGRKRKPRIACQSTFMRLYISLC